MARSIIVFSLASIVALGSAIFTITFSPRLLKRSLLTIVASGIALIIFASTRHIQLLSHRSRKRSARLPNANSQNDPIQRPPMDYNLFVLGSGGHTKEMLMMMDDGFCDFSHFHRRYLISSGDSMSENHLHDYEESLASLCKSPALVNPWTALLSIVDIFPALLVPPENEVGRKLRYPSRVFSNGPATGFFVALAVHLLKMTYIVPESCMKVIYIESWARISTLSLTGKLLLYTGIADVFVTQHQEVAARYGVQNAGEIVFNSRRLDDIEPSPAKC
ncbi:hypothetical protein TrVFT333_009622 [Trichoderma virens FT-333]|nr:hypothetical protein TrVFT333_009622 [Trichoderma virens FT-333]